MGRGKDALVMRVIFVGANAVAVMTAKLLIERGAEVVIIESDRSVIDGLSDTMDCSFLHGDGSSPELLRETNPEGSDFLFCLTDHDQINILASLVGRSLGCKRVVTSIQNSEYENICQELGLTDTIVPDRTISRYLADMSVGIDVLELHTVIKDEARLFPFVAGPDDAGPVDELDLPEDARVVWYYRDDNFHVADNDATLKKNDEVIIATHSKNLKKLRERWSPEEA